MNRIGLIIHRPDFDLSRLSNVFRKYDRWEVDQLDNESVLSLRRTAESLNISVLLCMPDWHTATRAIKTEQIQVVDVFAYQIGNLVKIKKDRDRIPREVEV